MYYRQALQLVPDIESRVSHGEEGGRTEEEEEGEGRGRVSEDSLPGLVPSFHDLSHDAVCEPKSPSSTSPGHTVKIFGTNPYTQEVHISALPAEVLCYILRWVVSAQLDMRALEQVARVEITSYEESCAMAVLLPLNAGVSRVLPVSKRGSSVEDGLQKECNKRVCRCVGMT